MIDRSQTELFLKELTGDLNTVIDWRCIHDTDKGRPAHNFRGTLNEQHATLESYNEQGYGIFACINQMDGQGRDLNNVKHIRAHVADLDNTMTAQASYERAQSGNFAVQSSPGKFHVYWRVQPYAGNDFYTMIQRKIAQFYDGDRSIIDATRVMRVPGFLHLKGEPFLVTCWPLTAGSYTHSDMEQMLQHVNVFDHIAQRAPLGSENLQAPSLEWLKFALTLADPSEMDRSEWLSFSAAFKQAGWNHTTEEELYQIWSEWCAQYDENDDHENSKLWNSIKDSEVGWKSIERRTTVGAYMAFGFKDQPPPPEPVVPKNKPIKEKVDDYGEILTQYDCQEYFKDCYFVENMGKIFNPAGRFMNATQFNGRYGGKHFIVTSTGKTVDEPWKAALRSTVWTIPKVDHVRFLPDKPTFDLVIDSLGRKGLNTYIPARIDSEPGDVSLWLKHLELILPDENDRNIFTSYLAHCVKHPGHKIPWAVLLQSAEGIGKSVFFEVMQHALGNMYVYTPKAPELVKSGSTFNAWMRGKLLIVVNEIKIDERLELIEILKPMITDSVVEIQSKGVDQDIEDNPANWLFFSNYKDAIPITKNGRRYSIFYSPLQSKADILNAGMDDVYFNRLWDWLRSGGIKHVTHWLMNQPVEAGGLPVRAPETSSHAEALARSRSPIEVIIQECIDDGLPGFRGGYVSTLAVLKRVKASGMRRANSKSVQTCLESMGFVSIGRASRAYIQEDVNNRSEIYSQLSSLKVEEYGRVQGYE